MAKINVLDTDITAVQENNEGCFCLTGMLKAKNSYFFITDWLRNRNTVEYIGPRKRFITQTFNYG